MDLVQLRRRFEKVKRSVPSHLPLTVPTFCPRMWGEAFINDHGDVYYCCHKSPYGLGNLHDAPLSELWNSARSKQMRTMSLTRTLLCYDRCRLLSEEEKETRPQKGDGIHVPYENLSRLKILMGELCNIQCIMCDQDHRSKKALSLEMLQTRIDWTHIDDIEFQGGEPMAIKSAKESYIWLTEEMGKKVNFLTNGTLMPEEWADRISRGSDWIYFSINGATEQTFEHVNDGAKLDKLRKHATRLLEARAKNSSSMELRAHFTMVPENIAEADRFPALAKEMGFDCAEYGYDLGSIPLWLESHPEERDRLKKSFGEILQNPPVPVNAKRLKMLGLVD